MASKLLNLIALSSLAVLVCTFGATPVNALATGHDASISRRHQHDILGKKAKRANNSKRCKTRSSTAAPTSTAAATTSHSVVTTTPETTKKASTTKAASHTKTSSKAVTTTAASSSGSSSGSKVGVAWPNGGDSSLKYYKTSKTNFLYTWSPDCPAQASKLGFECIPMLWGDNQVGQFQSVVKAGYAKYVLGMNEPNESGQSNMSPSHGAYLWKTYIQPLKSQGYELIAPATSSNPNGLTWVKNFIAACDGCTFDGQAVHWYDVSAQAFIDYINLWHSTFGKPIWVTEFACQNFNGGAQCSKDEVFSFMQTVTSYMESQDWVAAYFAFGVMHDMQGVNTLNQLMASSGQPTDLGYMYINGN
ncbi:hypothetical protein PUNSTDRAFT_84335 [Punctularia strigosozonata HHB-11173 SS5]|uniref:uncharacterized protein n=1 Tax=Punctularia strigosozonata (strain HHB-11173) TaxID=741275 RepID=UPI0004416312|nr:uncharacterized protein PUNSTDRAFT_84335 [Punctularia strigosozonata HHB-11173 SS5]EIN10357.1 hypothetical protein PUNSTDRAFT_84335 [Punctularia strigosozonata HHB-11173 SS5]